MSCQMVIRSSKDISSILEIPFVKDGEFYYGVHTTEMSSFVSSFMNCLSEVYDFLLEEISNSKLIDVWREKESIYAYDEKKPDDNVCYSQEYFALKNKITEDILTIIIVKEYSDVFSMTPQIVGTYREYKENPSPDIVYTNKFVDSIYNTPYDGVDFSTAEDYVRTKNLNCI